MPRQAADRRKSPMPKDRGWGMPSAADHRGWAAYWSDEALGAMRRASAAPTPATVQDLDMEHAVRSARLAFYHAAIVADYRYWERNYVLALGREL